MAEEVDKESKTEDATPRRREDARRQGLVPYSVELVGSLVLFSGVISLGYLGPDIWASMRLIFQSEIPAAFHTEFNEIEARVTIGAVAIRILGAIGPFMAVLMAVGATAAMIQVGFQINTEKLEPNFDKLNPVTGFQRVFSLGGLFRGLLGVLKLTTLSLVATFIIERRGGAIISLARGSVPASAAITWEIAMKLATYLVAGIVLVALIDYVYQRRKFENNLKMTKQELKDEMKQEEGDPVIKQRIRQIQRERSRRRMLAEVPKATVVITNPTHYAVALRYRPGIDSAPVVTAKGAGEFAKRLAEVARNAAVPVLERPVLARSLYSIAREGTVIPTQMFRAVAEVLAFIFRIRGSGPEST